jgi:predicted unusual protein kinase regulating ubiquinone biosynthesis (AarF/ABC1/UbiB family)
MKGRWDERDNLERVGELLARLSAESGTQIPTSALGRLRRTATAAVRTGAGLVVGRLRGHEGIDAQVIERLVLSMGELKGIAMKMGQILSYMDTSLPPEARELLSILQVRSQPTSFAVIESTLREDFGARADLLLAGLVREPVATASIGQVHRARLPGGVEVAVKVRHPGVEAAIRADFRSASIGKSFARLLAPGSDVNELVGEAQARFLEECDYSQEAQRQTRFAALYAGHPVLVIPTVHADWCSGRVLTTGWHDGVGVDAFVERATQAEKDLAGRALYEFYLGSLYRHGLFNADPHPGNLLFEGGGRVVVLDHGCVREFDPPTVAALADLSGAVRAGDDGRIRSALQALGVKKPDGPGFSVTLRLLRGFFEPVLKSGVRPMEAAVSLDVREVTRSKKSMMQLQLPGKLLFLFRIRFGLYAVLARLGAKLDWQAMEAEFSGRS